MKPNEIHSQLSLLLKKATDQIKKDMEDLEHKELNLLSSTSLLPKLSFFNCHQSIQPDLSVEELLDQNLDKLTQPIQSEPADSQEFYELEERLRKLSPIVDMKDEALKDDALNQDEEILNLKARLDKFFPANQEVNCQVQGEDKELNQRIELLRRPSPTIISSRPRETLAHLFEF